MLTDNATPFAAIGFEQWHRDGPTMAVVAVRGSYIVDPDGALSLADKQAIVLADEFAGDPHRSPLVRPSDLVPFKPATDVTFLGDLVSGDGAAHPVLEGAITVGGRRVTICGTGVRHWEAKGETWNLSEPEPTDRIALCYTHANGGRLIGNPNGAADPRNPIGTGLIDPAFSPKGCDFAAPRLFWPQDPIHDDFSAPPFPATFGPMAPWWRTRQQHAGSYDDEWVSDRHPRLPADFNYAFYNCAHPALLFPGYLAGSMSLELCNLGTAGKMSVHLPEEVPVARFSYSDGREVSVALNLDGVHLDFRNTPWQLDLTWRGWIDTCPSFYRADLEVMTQAESLAATLLTPCEAGVQEMMCP